MTSFGTGDEAFQANRLTSETKIVADGYVVEASISLLEAGGLSTFHGLDFQVNDATAGIRTSIRNWADPTGLGYQSTSRWGVGRLVAAPIPTSITYAGSPRVKMGKAATFAVVLSAAEASCVGGQPLSFSFDRDPVTGATGPTELGEATTNADGRAKLTVGTAGWTAGSYELTVSYDGNELGVSPRRRRRRSRLRRKAARTSRGGSERRAYGFWWASKKSSTAVGNDSEMVGE